MRSFKSGAANQEYSDDHFNGNGGQTSKISPIKALKQDRDETEAHLELTTDNVD